MTPSATSPNDPTRLQEEFDYFLRAAGVPRGPGGPPIDSGGPGGDNGGMEPRVRALEDAMGQVRQDLAVMRSNYVTKADLSDVRGELKAEIANAKTAIIMWVVGAIFLAQILPALPGIVRGIMSALGQS